MSSIPTKEEMNEALCQRVGKELQAKISSAVVAVCGLGGLGSNIAYSLARAGVGTLILIDFDRVDVSNLNRQQYKAAQIGMEKPQALAENLREIAPYIALTHYTQKITPENVVPLLSGADIICEAFDAATEKSMLVNAVLEQLPDKYLVAGSGMARARPAQTASKPAGLQSVFICAETASAMWTMECGLVSHPECHAVRGSSGPRRAPNPRGTI